MIIEPLARFAESLRSRVHDAIERLSLRVAGRSGWHPWGFATAALLALGVITGPFHPAHLVIVVSGLLSLLALVSAVAGIAHVSRKREAERLLTIGSRMSGRMEGLRDLEWQIKENETRYRDLLDQLDALVVRRDGDGRLTFVNRAFCRATGHEQADLLGKPYWPVVLAAADGVEPSAPPNLRRSIEQIQTVLGPRWFAFEQREVPSTGDHRDEVQCVGRDVTDEREAARLLGEARDEAEAANRAKSRFLAAMSHEIRTPMNGILGMAGLLLETAQTPDQRTYSSAIDQSARTLLALIDEILDFSKIEAGRLNLDTEPFELDELVQGAVELLAPKAHGKGLELAWIIDPRLPRRMIGDPMRLRQILLNLIGNAIKFTDRGGVMVTVVPREPQAGRVALAFEVRDTGIGLTPMEIKGLFSEFEQAGSPINRQRGGSGLGLAISKRLAQAMGGGIRVASEPGRGATFTADLMFECLGEVEPPLRPAISPALPNVLLVLDRLIERHAMVLVLQQAGVCADECETSAAESLIRAAAEKGAPYGVLIFDGEDDPAEAGRCLAYAIATAPTHAVRGIVLRDVLTRGAMKTFALNGIHSYIVRPVRPQSLLAMVALDRNAATEVVPREALPHPARPIASPDEPLSMSARPLRILLAEDNAINALLARHILRQCGCEIEHVGDGRAAVDAISASIEGNTPRFDLVLMDVHMPRLDGLEATRGIRRLGSEVAVNLPIVALTANAFPEDRRDCLAAGMDDYLAKPFDRSDITAILERWIPPSPCLESRTADTEPAAATAIGVCGARGPSVTRENVAVTIA